MADGGNKLVRLRAKLAEISNLIDDAEMRKNHAKTETIAALTELENKEINLNTILRRYALLENELKEVRNIYIIVNVQDYGRLWKIIKDCRRL